MAYHWHHVKMDGMEEEKSLVKNLRQMCWELFMDTQPQESLHVRSEKPKREKKEICSLFVYLTGKKNCRVGKRE